MRKLIYSFLLIFILINVGRANELFQANLHILVLQSALLEFHPNSENNKEYKIIFDKIYMEILPKFDFEPDEQLITFYEFISKYEISKLKYFIPLLKKIKANLKMRLMDGEEDVIQDHHDLLNEVLEVLETKLKAFEKSLDLEADEDIEDSSQDSQEDSEENSEEEESPIDDEVDESGSEIDDLKKEISSLKESITESVSKIGDLQSKIEELKKNDESIEVIQEKINEMAEDREKVLEELKALKDKTQEYEKSKSEILEEIAALKEKLEDAPEMPQPPEEPTPVPAPKPAPIPEMPIYKKPPFFCDFRIYGSKAAAVKAIMVSILASKANQPGFDPRVHKVIKDKWSGLLNKYNYRALPTELIGDLGNAGIKVQLGLDSKALELSKENYLLEVKNYLKNGGQKCLVDLAKTAGLDYKTKKLNCK